MSIIESNIQSIPAEFSDIFKIQKAAYEANRNPCYDQRRADLQAMHRLLVENKEALIDAVNRDYGTRSRFETILTELVTIQDGILDTVIPPRSNWGI